MGFQLEEYISDLEKMKKCYGYLFEIENGLRDSIATILREKYGSVWSEHIKNRYKNNLVKKTFRDLYFHELISFISMVPEVCELYSKDLIIDLKNIIYIRNKISHCIVITNTELDILFNTYTLIKTELTTIKY